MTPTPRTDDHAKIAFPSGGGVRFVKGTHDEPGYLVFTDFARELERENVKLLAANAELIDVRAELSATADELRAENAELRKDKARLEEALKEAAQRFRNSTVEWEDAARHCEEALS
jgi:predicted nuclease with TOPRIM domain